MLRFERLITFISSFIDWTTEEQETFTKQLIYKKYKAGTVILAENEVCDKLFYINKGILCNTLHSETAKPIVPYFAIDTGYNYITDLVGFLNGMPSMWAIHALEDTECILIPHTALSWLYDNVPQGNKFGILLYEHWYLMLAKLNQLSYVKIPDERYRLMLEIFPGIESRISQRYLSAFIRVDPAYFSRLGLKQKIRCTSIL